VKVASCLAANLALGVTSAAGALQAVKVPNGFRVETYARGLEKPTAMAGGPRGVLYVTQAGGEVVGIDPRTRPCAWCSAGSRRRSHPLAVAVDARGGLLVADYGRGVIYGISYE
jgi:glucose/arabinose dehydrogenase